MCEWHFSVPTRCRPCATTSRLPPSRNAGQCTRAELVHDGPAPTPARIVDGETRHRHLVTMQSPTDSEVSQRSRATSTPTTRPRTCWTLILDASSVPPIKRQQRRPKHRWGPRSECRRNSRANVTYVDRPLRRGRIGQRQPPNRSPSDAARNLCRTILGSIVPELSETLSERLVLTWKSRVQQARYHTCFSVLDLRSDSFRSIDRVGAK